MSNPRNIETRVETKQVTGEVFVDSWGWVWETCSPEDPEAEAFGPVGTAKDAGLALHWIISPYTLEADKQGWTWVNFTKQI